jgi:uncharacterized protein (TIGR02301 family)
MTRHARHGAAIGLVLLPLCLTAAVGVATIGAAPALAQTAAPSSKKAPASPAVPTSPAPQGQDAKPAPYDGQMMRLAEVLGSVSYLRTLCGADGDATGDVWRSRMQRLLESDTGGEPQRRERLTAAFNRGYRSFAAVHRSCTDAARQAEQRYRNEGATLAAEIAARYGN